MSKGLEAMVRALPKRYAKYMPPLANWWIISRRIFSSSSVFFCSMVAGGADCWFTIDSSTSDGSRSPFLMIASSDVRSSTDALREPEGDGEPSALALVLAADGLLGG